MRIWVYIAYVVSVALLAVLLCEHFSLWVKDSDVVAVNLRSPLEVMLIVAPTLLVLLLRRMHVKYMVPVLVLIVVAILFYAANIMSVHGLPRLI